MVGLVNVKVRSLGGESYLCVRLPHLKIVLAVLITPGHPPFPSLSNLVHYIPVQYPLQMLFNLFSLCKFCIHHMNGKSRHDVITQVVYLVLFMKTQPCLTSGVPVAQPQGYYGG